MTAFDRPQWIAARGFVALAVAMGIGRFAFTPILPMMQDDFGLTVRDGGWLAAANYIGYFAGALSALHGGIRPQHAIRLGLAMIALSTLAMVFFQSFAAWCLLRFLPGLASAWVLVFTSAWALEQLSKAGRSALDGVVYAGVGSGIVFAGLICLVASHAHAGSGVAWAAMGIAALLAAVLLWPMASTDITQAPVAPGAGGSMGATEFWRLVCCYGAFGLGYIIPATFLPVMAKQAIADPTAFGWAWPIFGAAAAVSTFFAARLSQAIGARRVWAWGSLVMAAGVVAPLAVSGLPGIMLGALCVGGTFMVNTMAGMQEARRVAGTHARPVMAAMTSAFAAGQIVGPLLVSSIDGRGGLAAALIASAVLLCAAAGVLYATGSAREPQT